MSDFHPPTICLIPGDGIGREVIPAAAQALDALEIGLRFVEVPAGFEYFQKTGNAIPDETLAEAAAAGIVLFGATSSPSTQVQGYRSPILALRKTFDLYANLRPVFSLPGSFSRPDINLLVVRENTQGLYAGRERMEGDAAIAERVISPLASERIARVAFEQARLRRQGSAFAQAFQLQPHAPPQVTAVHKANVLKLTDGVFRGACLRVAEAYPDVRLDELLVDAAAMCLVRDPEHFDVLVTTNLFGDILSDEASALMGGLGVAPSANLGEEVAVFEPVHGSAPDIAGQGLANPLGAIFSAVMLLEHIRQPQAALRLARAACRTLRHGLLTRDLGGAATTQQVTRQVIDFLSEPEEAV
jgi:homoisocitrate dehydrogenase